jgi:hypothetical protein
MFWAAASPQGWPPPLMSLFPFKNPLLKIRYKVMRRMPKGYGTWVYDPPSPRPSPPLRRGERVEGVGGCNTISYYKLSFWAAASALWALAAAVRARPPCGRARPSPLHIKKVLASKWYNTKYFL